MVKSAVPFWFYHASGSRTPRLKAMEKLFEVPLLSNKSSLPVKDVFNGCRYINFNRTLVYLCFKGGNQTRWESSKEATDVLRKIMPAVLPDLSMQARHEPMAEGLYRFFKHKFLPPTLLCTKNCTDNFRFFKETYFFTGGIGGI